MLEEEVTEMNKHITREEVYNGKVKKSNIDHIFTNTPEKKIELLNLSTSEHKKIKLRKIKTKDKIEQSSRKEIYFKNLNFHN